MFWDFMVKAWIMAPRGRNWNGAGGGAIVGWMLDAIS